MRNLDPRDPTLSPAETAEIVRQMNAGGVGTRRGNTGPTAPTLPDPPAGWVEPPLPPDIQREIDQARIGTTPSSVGGETPGAKTETPAGPAVPPGNQKGPLLAPGVSIRPAHSQAPLLRSVDLEKATLYTNDGSYVLTPAEVKAIHLVCSKAIARSLRDYIKALKP